MSKAAKQSVFILIVLLVGSLVFAGYVLMEKQKLEESKTKVERQLSQTEQDVKAKAGKIRALESDVKDLTANLKRAESEKANLDRQLKANERKLDNLNRQIDDVSKDRDKWERRVNNVMAERDELIDKLKEKEKEIVAYKKERQEKTAARQEAPQTATPARSVSARPGSVMTTSQMADNEEHWADVLKQKAELEIKLEGLQGELSTKTMEIVDLKQKVSDYEVEIDSLKIAKEDVDREIKYKEDLVDKISLELARTKNDKKMVVDRNEKLSDDNAELRKNIKQLVASKGSLEKAIVRLSNDKNKIEKELGKTDSIIQSKIDEIWEIKESLDETLKKGSQPDGSGEIELPPIVVSSESQGGPALTQDMSMPGFDGRVVSVNKENNFVIVDIGEKVGVRLGDILSVYRDSKYIARVEVIQVRRDISAADIKDQWSEIRDGDIIR